MLAHEVLHSEWLLVSQSACGFMLKWSVRKNPTQYFTVRIIVCTIYVHVCCVLDSLPYSHNELFCQFTHVAVPGQNQTLFGILLRVGLIRAM